MKLLVLLVLSALGMVLLYECSNRVEAQDPHAQYHNQYQRWSSQKTGNCCNNQDCRPLQSGEWREGPNGVEIYIGQPTQSYYPEIPGAKWCPVKQEHFILTGKSPDATVPHACVRPYQTTADPCDRLLCFVDESKS